jgi:hypothetical protein
MRTRHIGLLALLLAAFVVFIAAAISSPNWSAIDVGGYIAFAVLFGYVASRLLVTRANSEDHSGLPALLRAAFASLALAMALAMLLSIAALPWFGLRVFDSLMGQDAAWSLPLLAAILYPLVRRRLR